MFALANITCSVAYGELTEVGDSGSSVLAPGKAWDDQLNPKLVVSGHDNTYNREIDATSDQKLEIEFQDGAYLEMDPGDFNVFVVNQNGNLKINGDGTLRVDNPGQSLSLQAGSGIYIQGGPTYDPSVDITGNMNLIIEARRGITLGSHSRFRFDSPEGSIYIGGGQEGPGLYERGLLTGIILRAEEESRPTDLYINAKNLYIYSGGASLNDDNTELISTTAIENPRNSRLQGDLGIDIHADTVALLVSDVENSVPKQGKNGFGIYSQSGANYESNIKLSGNDFGFSAPVSRWYGIYMIDWGAENHVSLDFNDSVQMHAKDGYTIYLVRLLAPNIGDSTLDIKAGKNLLLTSQEGVAVGNSGGTINLQAPDINITSNDSWAIWTTNYSTGLGGNTSIEGNNILISSQTSNAIVSQGKKNEQERNGITSITGGNVYVESTDQIAVYSKSNGATIINADQANIVSKNQYAVYSSDKGLNSIEAGQIGIASDTGIAILTDTAGETRINGDDVTITSNALPYTIFTDGADSLTNINYDEATQAQSQKTTRIRGRVFASNGGEINIGLSSASSAFVGSTDDGDYFKDQGKEAFAEAQDVTDGGKISIYANNGSVWQVQPNPISLKDSEDIAGAINQFSNLSHYHSDGFSLVDLTAAQAAQDLNITRLSGNTAAFKLRTYIDDQRITGGAGDASNIRDHVNILHGTGEHFILINSTGLGHPYEKQSDYLVWSKDPNALYILDPHTGQTDGTPGDDTLSFRLGMESRARGVVSIPYVTAISKIDMGIYNYVLATRDKAHDGIDMDGVEYYLLRDDSYTPSTDLDRTLSGFGAEYAVWWAELSDLRKRLGEVRYGAQDGPWVRFITQKDDIDGVGHGSFTQKTYGINLGFDHIVAQDEDRMWLLGGNLKYANSNQKIRHSAHGRGDMDNWGFNLYATYANQRGYYSDLVFTFDHYDREASSQMLNNRPVKGDWSHYGIGASIEVGKMMSSTQDDEGWGPWYNHWWLEPQAQLAYYHINGKTFTLSNGLKAGQDSIDFLTGRLGLVLGKKFNYRKNRNEVDKRFSQFYVKGGLKHEFLGDQDIWIDDGANRVKFSDSLGETRFYYGAGFDWNMTDQMKLYAQIEREHGEKYMKDYEFSVGMKWQF